MGLSIWQILIVAVVVVLLFGRGKVSELMGDVGKGIKSFKKGLSEEDKKDKLEESSGEVIDAKAEKESSSS